MPEKPTFANESYYYEGVMTIAENMVPKPDPQICAEPREIPPAPEPEPDPEPPAAGDGGK